ncbi:MAG: restriction endonuclease, partial [Nitrosomonas sp.]|nr:restriction endonuclease [Nitrosomonas sp.]
MAKNRAKSRKEPSFIAMVITSDWWFSAIISSGIFTLTFFMLPAIAMQNMYLRPLVGTFKSIFIISGGFFALIAAFNYFRQKIPAISVQVISKELHTAHHAKKNCISSSNDPQLNHGFSNNGTKWGSSGLQNNSVGADKTKNPTVWSIALLQSIEWKLFEDLSAAYYKEKGIYSELTKLGADGGIDIKLFQDDSKNPTSLVQCKAWNTRQVGVKVIREFLGVMSHEKIPKGFIMTSGFYSDDAKEVAKANRITLIDGVMLLAMIQRLPTDAQQRLLDLATDGDYTTPSCPSCGVKMLRRSIMRGDFWWCKNFPRCRQMLHVKSGQ